MNHSICVYLTTLSNGPILPTYNAPWIHSSLTLFGSVFSSFPYWCALSNQSVWSCYSWDFSAVVTWAYFVCALPMVGRWTWGRLKTYGVREKWSCLSPWVYILHYSIELTRRVWQTQSQHINTCFCLRQWVFDTVRSCRSIENTQDC